MVAITDSGENIHLTRQATPKMASVTINHEMKARLSDGSTMDSTHISTLQLPGLIRLARQIQIFPKIQTSPLISLGVLWDDGCNITLDKQSMPINKNGE